MRRRRWWGKTWGRKQPERAEILRFWRTGFYNMIFLGVIGGFFFLIYADAGGAVIYRRTRKVCAVSGFVACGF